MEEYQRIYAVFKNDDVLHIDHTRGNCYKWIHNTFKDDLPKSLAVHQVKTIQTKDTQQKASEVVPYYLEWKASQCDKKTVTMFKNVTQSIEIRV